MESDSRHVLLVEDNPRDAILTRLVFDQVDESVKLHHVRDGRACLSFLRREEGYEEASRPDIVLLDLNLPVMDGRRVLAEIVVDEDLRHLPVIILTTSSDPDDVLQMHRLRCSAFVTKPIDFSEFTDVIGTLVGMWFDKAELPRTEAQRGLQ